MLPCMQFPTTVLFLDDDILFLESLKLRAENKLNMKLFTCHYEAFEKLSIKDRIKLDLFENCDYLFNEYSGLNNLSQNDSIFKIKWDSILKIAMNEHRFRIPSVIVVDYNMPDINGLDFLRKIKHINIKKIMLTGEADDQIGINAFNEGLINRFMSKRMNKLFEELCGAITSLQDDFFKSYSNFYTELKTDNSDSAKSPCLKDFYKNMKNSVNAVEHYLLDKNGSMLFITEDGRYFTLIVHNKETAEANADFLREHKYFDLAEEVESLKKLLYLPNMAGPPHVDKKTVRIYQNIKQ